MSKYSAATIDVTLPNGASATIDLEDMGDPSVSGLASEVWEQLIGEDAPEDARLDQLPEGVAFANPEGFAVHLFQRPEQSRNSDHVDPLPSFDDILSAWTDETSEDRREAMGEYLDDMGANDLSDFDEAYQGQYASGAAFSEQLCEDLGTVPKDFPSWISIDWERTWDANIRHDYHITDSGYVFRNL